MYLSYLMVEVFTMFSNKEHYKWYQSSFQGKVDFYFLVYAENLKKNIGRRLSQSVLKAWLYNMQKIIACLSSSPKHPCLKKNRPNQSLDGGNIVDIK